MQNIKDSNLVWVYVLYPNTKPYSTPGHLVFPLAWHSRRPWWTGVDGLDWTGLDYELGDLGVDRIFYMCLYSRYFFSGWALTYLPDSLGKWMNGIKMQVVPLKIRFKSCRIARDSTMKLIMILKAVAAGRLMWEVGVEPGYHRSLKV